jgi:hypothetical protein
MEIVAVILIIAGLGNLFAGDLVWEMTKFNNDLEGRVSERSETWEGGRIGSGCVMLVVGIIMIIIGISNAADRKAELAHVPYSTGIAYQRGSDPAVERVIAQENMDTGHDTAEWYRVPVTGTAYDTRQRIVDYYMGRPNHSFCSGGAAFVQCGGEGGFRVSMADLPGNEVLVKWRR